MSSNKKKQKEIDVFEWECVVAAWRYYEHRSTIAAVGFPSDLVKRYFASGDYSEDDKERLANQFAKVDHGLRGIRDWHWKDDGDTNWMHEYHQWIKFYAFCKAYVDGFTELNLKNSKTNKTKTCKAFFLETTGKWYPVDDYLNNAYVDVFVPPETIVR